jgi:hypothetical protein
MIVKTSRPVLYDGSYEHYLSLDGTSPSAEILAFQKWVNSKGEKLVDEDGLWNVKTSTLYPSIKARYERELLFEPMVKLKPNYTPSNVVLDEKGNIKSLESNNPVIQAFKQIVPMKQYTGTYTPAKLKVSWWAKRSKAQKGLIMGGGIAVIAVVGFLIYKQTKK